LVVELFQPMNLLWICVYYESEMNCSRHPVYCDAAEHVSAVGILNLLLP